MKQFDIEKAKKGAAVCLRDGTPVKILDFDFEGLVVARFQEFDKAGRKRDRLEKFAPHELYMSPKFAYMNVFKAGDDSALVGGVIRATHEECIEAGEADLNANLKWFCVARVELLDEGEGGEEC